jgi:hypothetical protein
MTMKPHYLERLKWRKVNMGRGSKYLIFELITLQFIITKLTTHLQPLRFLVCSFAQLYNTHFT